MVQAVCCVLVGHGLSEGERAMVSEFNTYCKDVIQHINIIRNKYPNIPIFIIGYSMVSDYWLLYYFYHRHQQQQ